MIINRSVTSVCVEVVTTALEKPLIRIILSMGSKFLVFLEHFRFPLVQMVHTAKIGVKQVELIQSDKTSWQRVTKQLMRWHSRVLMAVGHKSNLIRLGALFQIVVK